MKNILVPIESHSSVDSVLQTALLIARRFDGYIEGMPLGPDLPDLVAFDMPVSWTITDQNTWKEMADEAHARFEAFMTSQGVVPRSTGSISPCFGWTGERSFGDSQIGSYGRIFDCTVLGRPGADRGDPRMATAEAALFESGRPIILAPPIAPKVFGETVVIAWNQSMETARATAMAMSVLRRASKVFVMTIDEFRSEGPTGDHLAELLQHNGIAAEYVVRGAKGRNSGDAILRGVEALGGDLLVKGAYTQSRLRQMFFGGATSHIMANAVIPVFMTS
ncbi:MAG: Universal stress protein family protein [Hyphomicrobiales bacterium]|nr:Universal stress protein family protein [Hyphomicrobiales bacterium]